MSRESEIEKINTCRTHSVCIEYKPAELHINIELYFQICHSTDMAAALDTINSALTCCVYSSL